MNRMIIKYNSGYTFFLVWSFMIICLQLPGTSLNAQEKHRYFTVIPLGVKGGLDESNLSSYLVGRSDSSNYVCVDAGTVRYGIMEAIRKGSLKGSPDQVLRGSVKGYLISHGHLDHLAGLVINAPGDTAKDIYAMPFTLKALRENYFTWQSWANFSDEGEKPALKTYHYITLSSGMKEELKGSGMDVEAYQLSHSTPGQSTAFLIHYNENYLLYLGDTGPDSIEGSHNLQQLWTRVAPLIKAQQLKALFIEVSFPNSQPDKKLFGHLTPAWLYRELEELSALTGFQSLQHLPIVITHIKPDAQNEALIKKELQQGNEHKFKIVFPSQGERLFF